jgi:peroxiredoxin
MFNRSHFTRRQWLMVPGVALAAASGALQAAVPAAGQAAPDFALKGLDGQNLRLREQRGHVVLLNFWATWCGPCREEMPQLSRLQEKYRSAGLLLLGVNVDDDSANAASVAAKLGVKFPVLLDTDKQVSKLYDISAMPSTVLIDRDGRVRHLHKGYREGTAQTYEQQIRELLKD